MSQTAGLRLGLTVAAVVGIGSLALYSYHSTAVRDARVAGEASGRAEANRISHHSDVLLSGGFPLSAGDSKAVRIAVTSDMSETRVTGRFSASGGTRNDIEVLLFPSHDDVVNWQNDNDSRVLYQSGRKTVSDFDIPLATPGTYELIFSNKHAIFLVRDIQATVKLTYDKR